MKKYISLILVIVLCFSLCACGAQSSNEPAVAGEGQVVDGAGRVVDIPENPEEATIASVYAVAVPFIVSLGLSDRVLAANIHTKFWTDNNEYLAKVGTIGRGVVDLEKLAEYDPTVLIHRSNDPETIKALDKIGTEALCITVENIDDIKYTLTTMGKYFGVEERAQEVCDWIEAKFDMMAELSAKIPEDERVTAMVMGGELGRVSGNDMLQSWMIEQAGGICVADRGKDHNWVDVGVETVFRWNPQFIFCTGSTGLDYNEDSMLKDEAWSAVQAVKDGNVIQMPAKLDAWDMPGLSCIIGTLYMMHEMYPDHLSAEELQAQIDEYYEFMFGSTFDPDYLGYSLEK